jgi:hypothetical protein
MNTIKVYDEKFFGGVDFYDNWNLREHHLFMMVEKKEIPYLRINEEYFDNSIEVKSLQDIANYLRKEEWIFESKFWIYASRYIQGYLNSPYS